MMDVILSTVAMFETNISDLFDLSLPLKFFLPESLASADDEKFGFGHSLLISRRLGSSIFNLTPPNIHCAASNQVCTIGWT